MNKKERPQCGLWGKSSGLRLCGFIDIVYYGDFCNNRLKLINSDGDGKEWEYRLFRFGEKNDHGAGWSGTETGHTPIGDSQYQMNGQV